jgi:hypothetical protein
VTVPKVRSAQGAICRAPFGGVRPGCLRRNAPVGREQRRRVSRCQIAFPERDRAGYPVLTMRGPGPWGAGSLWI